MKDDKRKKKKREIILSSLNLILRKGYNGTGVQDIANAAGIPKGSFYNYFKSKEDFAIEILDYYTENRLELFTRYLSDSSVPPLDRIKNLFKEQIKAYEKDGFTSMGYLVSKICLEMADTSPSICKATEKSFGIIKMPLSQCLQEAKDAGEIDNSINTDEFADYIQNSWYGAMIHMKAIQNSKPLKVFYDVLIDRLLK